VCRRCELRLVPEGYSRCESILRDAAGACVARLSEAASWRMGAAIGRNGVAVSDLERPAVVIPLRDLIEEQPLHEGNGPACTQSEQGIHAQAEAVLAIGQDLRRLGVVDSSLALLRDR